jgi:post-segregation antitoxin CcdA/integrase-like protein
LAFKSFEEGRKFVHGLALKNSLEWQHYSKSHKKPPDIPANPPAEYKQDWKGWGDWLGTEMIANQNKRFLPFEEARVFVHQLGLNSVEDWVEYCKSGNKPHDISSNPNTIYKDKGWINWGDWLGTGYLKQKLTLGISKDVITKAKEVGINISEITEQVLKSVLYDPKGNTKQDLIEAYESLFDFAKLALQRYNTNFEVGIKEGNSIVLDCNNGFIYHDKKEPYPSYSISLSDAMPYLLPTKNIIENLILATTEGKEKNKGRIKELQLALRLVKALFDEGGNRT